MKPNLLVQKDPGQGRESYTPPSRRAAAPRLIPPGCRSGTCSRSIPGGSISSGRSAGHRPLPHPSQTAGRRDTGDACAQDPGSHPPGPPRRRVTIPLSSKTGWTSGTGTCLRAPPASARSRGSTACTRARRAPASRGHSSC